MIFIINSFIQAAIVLDIHQSNIGKLTPSLSKEIPTGVQLPRSESAGGTIQKTKIHKEQEIQDHGGDDTDGRDVLSDVQTHGANKMRTEKLRLSSEWVSPLREVNALIIKVDKLQNTCNSLGEKFWFLTMMLS